MQGFTDFWEKLASNIPDVVRALILLVVAALVAWGAKKLTIKLFKWFRIERALAKFGIEKKNIESTRTFVSKIVQLIVFVLFLPGVFQRLGLDSTATPIITMMNGLMAYLPSIIAGMLVLIIGLFIAKIVKELIYPLIKKAKPNEWLEKIGVKSKVDVADVLATTVYVIIAILFTVEAINALQLEMLTKVGAAITAYLPYALSAFLVLAIALILGKYIETTMINKFKTSKAAALTMRIAIVTIGTFMALDQLGIAKTTVNSAFIIILGGIMVAFALAFGMGGKDFAAHNLRKLENHISRKKK